MRPGSPENSFGTQNAGIYGTRNWWWQLFCYNFTSHAYPSSFFSPVFFHLLTLSYLPTLPTLLPLLTIFFFCLLPSFLSRSVCGTLKMILHLWQKMMFPFCFSSLLFQRSTDLHITYTLLFPFWGMGDLAKWLSWLLMGFVQLKSCVSQAFFKRVNFFRSTDRPG